MSLKVLLYIEPTLERIDTMFRAYSTIYDLPIKTLAQSSVVDFRLICADFTEFHLKNNPKFNDDYNQLDLYKYIIPISSTDLNSIPISQEQQRLDIYHNVCSESLLAKYKALYEKKLKDFKPDIIISYESPSEHLRKIFPYALLLNQYHSAIFRSVIKERKRDFIFDPSSLKDTMIKENIKAIGALTYSSQQYQLLDQLKHICKSNITKNLTSTIKNKITKLYKVFDKLYVLPLQGPHFNFSGTTNFDSQFDAICYVLNHTPKNYGILVTEHTLWQGQELTANNLNYLKNKYSNFIYLGINNLEHYSPILLYLCDGAIIISSFMFYIALFLNKEVFLLGTWGTKALATGNKLFSEDKVKNKAKIIENTLLFLANNLSIYQEQIEDSSYFIEYLSTLLYHYQKKTLTYKTYLEFNHLDFKQLNHTADSTYISPSMLDFLAKYPDAKSKEICKEILQKDIISFDIFDTLLVRSVYSPTDVFKLMEHDEKLDSIIKTFYSLRTYFESNTRTLIKTQHPKYEDITLDEIYANMQQQLALSDADTLYLKNLELATEKKVLYPRLYVQELYNLAKALKKKIIIVSDMYLTPDILTDLLHHNGFNGFDKLYLSSKIKLTKASGNLFKHILADLKVMPNTILHMGDNYKTDILKGSEQKLYCIHLPKPIDKFRKLQYCNTTLNKVVENTHVVEKMFYSVMANKLFHNPFVDYETKSLWNGSKYNIGYITMAPILLNTMLKMIKYAKSNKTDTIFFVLRDGYIPKQMFKILSSALNAEHIKAEYLLSNRHNSYSYFLLYNPCLLLSLPIVKPQLTVQAIINYFMLDDLNINIIMSKLIKIGIKPTMLIKNIDSLKLITIIRNNLNENKIKLIKNFVAYIESTIDKKKNNLIFDVGYAGTTQLLLSELNFSIPAFYLIENDIRYYPTKLKRKSLLKLSNSIKLLDNNVIIEASISYPYSVREMIKELNLSTYNADIPADEQLDGLQDILQIQAGLLDCTLDCTKYCSEFFKYYNPSADTAYALLSYFKNISASIDNLKIGIKNFNIPLLAKYQFGKQKPTNFSTTIEKLLLDNTTPRLIQFFIHSIQAHGKSSKKVTLQKVIVKQYIRYFSNKGV